MSVDSRRSAQASSVPATEAGGHDSGRRAFLGALLASGTALILPGCAGPSTKTTSALPGPAWPESDPWHLEPTPAAAPPAAVAPAVGGVISRVAWTGQSPTNGRLKPMRPVRYVTVHHSAGPPFWSTDQRATATQLDSIRRYHHDALGWGDIGYHYAVDRAGRVWECRPLHWQGAHVRDHNEGNIGVVTLGNFDQQEPSAAQLEALHRHVAGLMRSHRVPAARLRTHQEWAATACPGRSLQRVMVASRASGRIG